MTDRNLPNLGTHPTFILLQNQGEDKERKKMPIFFAIFLEYNRLNVLTLYT